MSSQTRIDHDSENPESLVPDLVWIFVACFVLRSLLCPARILLSDSKRPDPRFRDSAIDEVEVLRLGVSADRVVPIPICA